MRGIGLCLGVLLLERCAALLPRRGLRLQAASTASIVDSAATRKADREVDVVVIGSGLGGLSCAALLAKEGLDVLVLEQHYEAGGCAHNFCYGLDGKPVSRARVQKEDLEAWHFEAGPSLYSGLSQERSPNPLKHVFQMIGEEPTWVTYANDDATAWGAFVPEAPDGYRMPTGAAGFEEVQPLERAKRSI
eukprot:scaffold3300_cov239-Pinguiococcus_pyrenoidosus.AAC.8